MKYGSVCSGIEAATVAWNPLGWEPQWFSEIAPFPSAVLAHRWPDVPNLGDMKALHEKDAFRNKSIDLLVGGTPCQSFSIAGGRTGLADPRGNLALVFLRLVELARPRWVVWENVPGVLSSNSGRDFATFLTGLAQCGYGITYRILDAQHFGVPQRRRRVFVVGYLGDWRPAAAVLFEQEVLSGNPAPSRESVENNASAIPGRLRGSMWNGKQISRALLTTQPTMPEIDNFPYVLTEGRLRRFIPVEAEALQGFPANHTRIAYRGRPKERCPDGPRLKAIGESMAVPVMRWLGDRILSLDTTDAIS